MSASTLTRVLFPCRASAWGRMQTSPIPCNLRFRDPPADLFAYGPCCLLPPPPSGAGKFSTDRTIDEYAKDIWHAAPCAVPAPK
jgi:glucan phosphorylase